MGRVFLEVELKSRSQAPPQIIRRYLFTHLGETLPVRSPDACHILHFFISNI